MAKVLCWHCDKHEATRYDYRTFNGTTGKYLSCEWCVGLNNKTIREIQNERLDPKQFYKLCRCGNGIEKGYLQCSKCLDKGDNEKYRLEEN